MDLRQFIIQLAVMAFNAQYNRHYKPEDFDVHSVKGIHDNQSRVVYEIYTQRRDDYLRLRLYCTLGNRDVVGRFSLYDQANRPTGLGDEIFAADAVLDNNFLRTHNNIIREGFIDLLPAPWLEAILMMEENGTEPILLEDGGYIYLEEGSPQYE